MAAATRDKKAAQELPISKWTALIFTYLLIPLILLVCGWDSAWWQAWVFSLLLFLAGIGGRLWAEQRHPGLMLERVKFEAAPGVKAWDKVLSPLMAVSVSFPLFIVAGLDHRWGWSAVFPLWLNMLGFILATIGYALAVWAMVENRFFSSMVRIQTDRGQKVIDTGPYAVVRHPGYAAAFLWFSGAALALGSLWALIPAAVACLLLVVRTELEDRTLQNELEGYREYAERVRYRLIPGVW